MVLTVNKLYKVAKALEKDNDVLDLYNSWRDNNNNLHLTDIVVSVINNAGMYNDDEIRLFENDSLEISAYNGRLYYVVTDNNGRRTNVNISDEVLKSHKMTERGEKFIRKYLPSSEFKQDNSKKPYNKGEKKFGNKKFNNNKKDHQKSVTKKENK